MIDWVLLFAAITMVESGGDHSAVGDNGLAIGPMQIQPVMVDDVNRILELKKDKFRFTLNDRKFTSTSRSIARVYFDHYAKSYQKNTGKTPSYEYYARCWNGGPMGWKRNSTDDYWRKVKREIERLRLEGKK